MWSLAAFAIAALLSYLTKKGGGDKASTAGWVGVAAITLLGLVPICGWLYLKFATAAPSLYHLKVSLMDPLGNQLDPKEMPANFAKLQCSCGVEPMDAPGVWQFDIPSASLRSDGAITIFASVPSNHWSAQKDLRLAADHNPAVPIWLTHPCCAMVQGTVVFEGKPLGGVRVYVEGYSSEAIVTKLDGEFKLSGHAANGEEIQLHAEKKGFSPKSQSHDAGDEPATLALTR
jgi:hypothetical protein